MEYSFQAIKYQFGHRKVHYRWVAKNDAPFNVLLALSNLWMARRQLLAMTRRVRPQTGKDGMIAQAAA